MKYSEMESAIAELEEEIKEWTSLMRNGSIPKMFDSGFGDPVKKHQCFVMTLQTAIESERNLREKLNKLRQDELNKIIIGYTNTTRRATVWIGIFAGLSFLVSMLNYLQ